MKNKRNGSAGSSVLYLTRGAMVAACYVALTFVSSLAGLDRGAVQFRISEMLCVLPLFMPEAVVGLTLGCFIANLTMGGVILDAIFGSLATLIGALGARLLRRLPKRLTPLCTLPTVVANALIVPFVIIYAYGTEGAYPLFMLTVGLGELVCATLCGSLLFFALERSRAFKR